MTLSRYALVLAVVSAACAPARGRGAQGQQDQAKAHVDTNAPLHPPVDPPPPPSDGVRTWRFLAQGGIAAYGRWHANPPVQGAAPEDIPVGSPVGVAAMTCVSTTRIPTANGPVAMPTRGSPDMATKVHCASSAVPDNPVTRRIRACFRVRNETPSTQALAAMKAALEGSGGQSGRPTPDGPRQFVVATIHRSWQEPERTRTVRVGCEGYSDRPCDPVRIDSYPEGKWLTKSGTDWVAAGPQGTTFGGASGDEIFPKHLIASGAFLFPYDSATGKPHPLFAAPPSVAGGGDEAYVRIARYQLQGLRENDAPPEPDLRAAFLLDRVDLAYQLGDVAGARADDARLRREIAEHPPKDPSLKRALDAAIPALDGLLSGKYTVVDPCGAKR